MSRATGTRAVRGIGASLLATLLVAVSVAAQSEAPLPVPTDLPEPAAWTTPARFAVAGPVRPGDQELTLITAARNCGFRFDDPPWDAVAVDETSTTIGIRVDVRVLDDGTRCRSDHQVRIPIQLEAPLGERTIHDLGTDPASPALLNLVDPMDTGFDYACGGPVVPIVDLLGPGLDLRADGPQPTIEGARLIQDRGDSLAFIGPLTAKGAVQETWVHDGLAWQDWNDGICKPRAVLSPGLNAASWSLRGPRPGPKSRRLRINVQGHVCHGSPPVGQITRPIIQVRRDSIVIIMGTFFENQAPFGLYSGQAAGGFDFIDCNGYGPVRTTIKLPVAIGDRTLYDGGVYPPRVRGKKR